MNTSSPTIIHRPTESRFVSIVGGIESEVRYIESAATLEVVSTFVNPSHRGRSIAARLNDAAIVYAKQKGLTIIPTCSYTAAYLKRVAIGLPEAGSKN